MAAKCDSVVVVIGVVGGTLIVLNLRWCGFVKDERLVEWNTMTMPLRMHENEERQ